MTDARYILLDQGAFRSPQLRQRLENDANAYFVVPDVAFSEMVLKADPIHTISRSLESLRQKPARSFVSLSCNEVKELQKVRSPLMLSDILSGPATNVLRVLLEGHSSPHYGEVVDRILTTAPAHRNLYNARQDKSMMIDHVKMFSKNLGSNGLKALRAGQITDIEKLGIILMIMIKLESETGYFETDIDKRHLLVRLSRIMMWAERQGLENTSERKILNDFIDMNFVVIGSFFDETMTLDKTVAALDRTMRNAMDLEHSTHAVQAAKNIGFEISK